MIKEFKGDIFDYVQNGDYVIHQTNYFGVMGGGIALQIKHQFPNVFDEYAKLCATKTMEQLLGQAQLVKTTHANGAKFTICNCFGQGDYGRVVCYTKYDALENAMILVNKAAPKDARILIPKFIGCGLAGGDWNIVSDMIQKVFADREEVLLVEFSR